VTKGYSDAQVKVRKATSNEAWGPEGADMAEIAQMTFDRYISSFNDKRLMSI
jgi:epsin